MEAQQHESLYTEPFHQDGSKELGTHPGPGRSYRQCHERANNKSKVERISESAFSYSGMKFDIEALQQGASREQRN